MTDNTENSQKKVHLIKQPRPVQAEAPAPAPRQEDDSPEKRKVVVVKKKVVVVKKSSAKVVAHHEVEGGEAPSGTIRDTSDIAARPSAGQPAAVQAQPQVAQNRPVQEGSSSEKLPSAVQATSTEGHEAAQTAPAGAPASHAHRPVHAHPHAGTAAGTEEKPARTGHADTPAAVAAPAANAAESTVARSDAAEGQVLPQGASATAPASGHGQSALPHVSQARPAASASSTSAPASQPPAGSSPASQPRGYPPNQPRPYGAAGTVGGYPANRTQGGGYQGQGGYQGRSGGYQGRSGSPQGGGYQGQSGGYQGQGGGYQGRSGGYQGQGGGYQGQGGGYQGQGGGYQGQGGGYQGQGGGYQGQGGGYQGRSGGYQGQSGGYQGQGGGYQGRSGGYQGQSGGYQGQSGGYQGRPGGYQGQGGGYQGQSGGYQGQSGGYQGRPGGYQGQSGGYQGQSGGYQGGGYPRGPRPQGPGGPGAPGGYRPGFPGQGRPMGRAGNLAGGPRPGGFGGPRGPGSGPSPLETNKTGQRKPAPRKKPGFVRKEDVELEKELQLKKKAEARAIAIPKSIDIMENISVSDLAKKMNIKPAELIGKLMGLGVMATINQKIDAETATILASEYGCEVKIVSLYDETVIEREAEKPEDFMHRAPIVTVMGHVDHGKTKLLDAIRKTDVVSREYGGITQHIGAYQVETPRGKITFLDTPGHAAFTKMRARGSKVTDIVVLVVSAVEGVMPQTREAIDHAKAAEVPIIVAVNKIDLPESNPDRIKTQLSELGLIPEEWGGTTQFCEISALQKKGIPELLDAILLQAEILELEASYECNAEAKIIESRIDQGRGIVATIIVEKGTLRIGDSFVAGIYPGRVRAMFDDKGNRVDIAEPSTPVEVLGFEGIPNAGDPFEVVDEEKYARAISDKRQELKKYEEGRNVKKVTLDNLYETISAGEVQELKVIIKGDVQGSVEALKGMLEKLSTKEVRLNVLRSAAGAISDDDVMMASASDAIIIGFNVRPIASAKLLADREKVDIRKYNIIYRAQEDIQKAMEGLLSPELKEQDIGKAEVRNIFKVPKVGIIAGCYMLEGAVHRNSQVRVIREEIEIFQGKITSLKRFKDDAKEVVAGYECGIGIENCNDLKEGDILEIYETVEIARSLSKATENGPEKA